MVDAGNEYAQYSPHVLSAEEAEAVKAIKLSTYSNLAAAYIQLERADKALAACAKGEAGFVLDMSFGFSGINGSLCV